MVNFHNQMAKTPEDTGVIRTIIELEEDNILLNNMTKFHKVLIKVSVLNLLASNTVYKLLLKRLLQCINQSPLCVMIVDKPWVKSWFLSFLACAYHI